MTWVRSFTPSSHGENIAVKSIGSRVKLPQIKSSSLIHTMWCWIEILLVINFNFSLWVERESYVSLLCWNWVHQLCLANGMWIIWVTSGQKPSGPLELPSILSFPGPQTVEWRGCKAEGKKLESVRNSFCCLCLPVLIGSKLNLHSLLFLIHRVKIVVCPLGVLIPSNWKKYFSILLID